MKLKNSTKISNDVIRKFVNLASPGVHNFDIKVVNSRNYHGRAYPSQNCIKVYVNKEKLGKKLTAPIQFRQIKGKGYLGCRLFSNDEAILFLIAHELRHLWQAVHKKGYRVWGSKGQYSERDADSYALRIVRSYRKA